jgi:hypothetical protein
LELFQQCDILELFQQCDISELFQQCDILELFQQCDIFLFSLLLVMLIVENITLYLSFIMTILCYSKYYGVGRGCGCGRMVVVE